MPKITHSSSSEEIANPDAVSRDRIIERLRDWHDRVSKLYADIERELKDTRTPELRALRETMRAPIEELALRAGIKDVDVPAIEALRIEGPNGTDAAFLTPSGLWIIGGNGRIDLKIKRVVGSELYMLIDQSEPLSGPAEWVRVPVASPFDREPFTARWLIQKFR